MTLFMMVSVVSSNRAADDENIYTTVRHLQHLMRGSHGATFTTDIKKRYQNTVSPYGIMGVDLCCVSTTRPFCRDAENNPQRDPGTRRERLLRGSLVQATNEVTTCPAAAHASTWRRAHAARSPITREPCTVMGGPGHREHRTEIVLPIPCWPPQMGCDCETALPSRHQVMAPASSRAGSDGKDRAPTTAILR